MGRFQATSCKLLAVPSLMSSSPIALSWKDREATPPEDVFRRSCAYSSDGQRDA